MLQRNYFIYIVLDVLGIRSRYHCAVFSNGITSKIDDYVRQYEIAVSQVLMLFPSVHTYVIMCSYTMSDKTFLKN